MSKSNHLFRADAHGHAIVLGASMAGLLTARALAEHFRRVTIIERDRLTSRPGRRPGVPQSDHLHVLLPGGREAIEKLLPGFADGLAAAGAVPFGAPEDIVWMNPAGLVPRSPARHEILSASRELIEWHTRRRVFSTPGIRLIDGHAVRSLRSAVVGRVSGVVIEPIGGAGEERSSSSLAADLVVDATGRRSHAPEWLERLGFERPAETRIDAGLSYATRVYQRPADDPGWKALFLQAEPGRSSRTGLLFPIEGDRWMVTAQGAGGDHPPTDAEGFTAFLRSLRSPMIHAAVRDAQPLSSVVGFANTANRRRHYEKLRRWPDGFLVVGDAACAFNPVYAQGMTVAAQTAVALRERLYLLAGRSLDGFAKSMQREVAKVGNAAWMIATGDDLRLPTTTGAGTTRMMRVQHRYLDRVMAAATADETVLAAMMDALFLLRPPQSLFRPRIMFRTLRHRVEQPTPIAHDVAPGESLAETYAPSGSRRDEEGWSRRIHSRAS